MRVASSQSARSQMPGSRSSNRPCVSAMSSADGVKTSKTNRPVPAPGGGTRPEEPAPVVVRLHVEQRAERADHERERRSSTGGSRMSPWRRSTSTPASSALLTRDLEHPGRQVDADHLDAGGRDRHRDPSGADAELEHRAARAHRLLHVERHVLDDAPRPRVVDARDLVVGGHVGILCTDGRTTSLTLFSRPRCATGDAS